MSKKIENIKYRKDYELSYIIYIIITKFNEITQYINLIYNTDKDIIDFSSEKIMNSYVSYVILNNINFFIKLINDKSNLQLKEINKYSTFENIFEVTNKIIDYINCV